MNDDHEMVPVSQAQPGMMLSDELIDTNGQVLLAKGTVLTEAIIASLGRHHIDAVPVARVEAHRAPDSAVVRARVAYLFRKHPHDAGADWGASLLRRYIEDYRLERGVTP